MKPILLLALVFFSPIEIAISATRSNIIKYQNIFFNNGNKKITDVRYTHIEDDLDANYYHSERGQANPFVPYPFTILEETVTRDNKVIFSKTYRTGQFGLRQTLNSSPNATAHLILSGDSNMFGVGVQDAETLPSRLAVKIKSHSVYNMGLAGTGPSSALYFLEHFDLKKIITIQNKGIFLYDFHHYLFERVVGSKAYFAWGNFTPRYILENGELIYKGTFREHWIAWFYKFLNLIPFNETLIPNFPRISHSHIELTAKILFKIKEIYLRQTDANNRFIVMLNPANRFGEKTTDDLNYLIKCLKKVGIETIDYKTDDMLPLPHIEDEGHLSAIAHENYSKMILRKLGSVLK